jgi:hypothetical protein
MNIQNFKVMGQIRCFEIYKIIKPLGKINYEWSGLMINIIGQTNALSFMSYENPPLKNLHCEFKITRIILKPPHQLKSLVASNTTLKVCFTN